MPSKNTKVPYLLYKQTGNNFFAISWLAERDSVCCNQVVYNAYASRIKPLQSGKNNKRVQAK